MMARRYNSSASTFSTNARVEQRLLPLPLSLSLSLSLMRLNGVTYESMGFSRKSREMASPPHQTGAQQMWAV